MARIKYYNKQTGQWEYADNVLMSGSTSAGEHINNKENPHEVTFEQVGAAPAGFGLGGNGQPVTISELSEIDNIKKNGQYAVKATSVVHIGGVATHSFTLEVSMFTDEVQGVTGAYGHQTIKLLGYNTTLRRDCNNSVWSEFDWDNPPMYPGVEYRTTGRYGGKPVYTKAISIGNLPNKSETTVSHNIDNVDAVLTVHGYMKMDVYRVSIPYYEAATNWVGMSFQRYSIAIATAHDASAWEGTLILEYTKTTD